MRIFFDKDISGAEAPYIRQLYRMLTEINGWFVCDSPNEADFILTCNPHKISGNGLNKLYSLNSADFELIKDAIFEDNLTGEEAIHLLPPIDDRFFEINSEIGEMVRRENILSIRKLPWPGGKPFALAMTHDVDLTRKFGVKQLLKNYLQGDAETARSGMGELLTGRNSYWTFPELLDLYNGLKVKASFYFLVKIWEEFGYRYNIKSGKFRRLLKSINEAGHEIGLHSSKYAFDDPVKYPREKAKIDRLLSHKTTGIRQHYLRLRFPDAWTIFGKAGFRYDTSCGFEDKIGFRMGTSFPFPAPDGERFYEIPFSIMDYTWIETPETADQIWQNFENLAKNVISVNGLLNILWHPSNLAESRFRPFWDRQIEWIKQHDYFQDTLAGILDWWKKRKQVHLAHLGKGTNFFKIVLKSKEPVSDLTLEILTGNELKIGDGSLTIRKVAPERYHVKISRLSEGSNKFEMGLK